MYQPNSFEEIQHQIWNLLSKAWNQNADNEYTVDVLASQPEKVRE